MTAKRKISILSALWRWIVVSLEDIFIDYRNAELFSWGGVRVSCIYSGLPSEDDAQIEWPGSESAIMAAG